MKPITSESLSLPTSIIRIYTDRPELSHLERPGIKDPFSNLDRTPTERVFDSNILELVGGVEAAMTGGYNVVIGREAPHEVVSAFDRGVQRLVEKGLDSMKHRPPENSSTDTPTETVASQACCPDHIPLEWQSA